MLQVLRRLIIQLESPTNYKSSPSAHSGTASASNLPNSSSWIMNRSTDPCDRLPSYPTCSGKGEVRRADGSLSTMAGSCSVTRSSSISLSSFLHVQKFSHNLLCTNTITNNVGKILSKSLHHKLGMGRMIASGKANVVYTS